MSKKYLSLRSKIARSAVRRCRRLARLLARVSAGAPHKKKRRFFISKADLRIAAANLYTFITLRHLQITGERLVAEPDQDRLTGYERRAY